MADVLQVERREELGTSATTRLRRTGRVPAVLYGHGQANEHVSVSNTDVKALLRHHSKTVELEGDVKDTALVSEMQWDALGIQVLHMDLIRVDLNEKVEVTLPIRLYGDAAGVRDGGMLLENRHDVEVSCPAGSIPENLVVDINTLGVGEKRVAGDLVLPEGVELITPAETAIVHIEAPKGESDDEAEEDTEE